MIDHKALLTTSSVFVALASSPLVLAQDSVASLAGSLDALSAYDSQRVRYVLDLSPGQSSFGNPLFVGPVLKASADPDSLVAMTHLLGSTAISPALQAQSSNSDPYAFWTTAGQGVHPSNNSAPAGSLSPSAFDASLVIGASDLGREASNVFAARVGFVGSEPGRVYVERVMALSSRSSAGFEDTATLALGSVNAAGFAAIRADDQGIDALDAVSGDIIATVDLEGRNASVNTLSRPASTNVASDSAATTLGIQNLFTPLNLPAQTSTGTTLAYDFSSLTRFSTGSASSGHLAAEAVSHRGNPSISSYTTLANAGVLASLGQSSTGRTDLMNLAGIQNTGGSITFPDQLAAVLPSAIDVRGTMANNPTFNQYLSQESFRGPAGQVAVGFDPSGGDSGILIAAAVAEDENAGQFVAVARFEQSGPIWEVAVATGDSVLDGVGGQTVGSVQWDGASMFSAPALDSEGNVYVVASYLPSGGGIRTGLLKGNRQADGRYELELLLEEGQSFIGQNSATSYTIERIARSDSDSLAAGAFHAGMIVPQSVPGVPGFGALAVATRLSYSRGEAVEVYDAVLLIAPGVVQCEGDANGDLAVNVADFIAVLLNFGQSGPTPGDANQDGRVDVADFISVLLNFGSSC